VLVYLYYLKVISYADFNGPSSMNAVAAFETFKPYQFRLLMPVLFMLFKPLTFIPEKGIYAAYSIIVVYFLLLVYYNFLCKYFDDKQKLFYWTPVILYPMLWNYVILNQSFQYYDFTTILIFTIGLYFIVTENFAGLLIIYIIGIINKESVVYLAFSYLLFNYKDIFTKKVILNTLFLGIILIVFKVLTSYLFKNNPGDTFEVGWHENLRILLNLFNNRVFMKNLGLNFGGLYILVILLFISGRWKKFPDKRLIFLNLAFIPYLLLGFYMIYFTEVRVYTELIPMITTLSIVFISSFEKFKLKHIEQR
jgi:hypothetical protein